MAPSASPDNTPASDSAPASTAPGTSGSVAPASASSSTAASPTYHIKEVFRTVQGEGFWAGRPAVFVRMVGCNMWSGYEDDRERDAERTGADCPLWCDTDFTKEGAETYSVDELVGRMLAVGNGIDFCVITGGEPLLQLDPPLVRALHDAGFEVACETNGTVRLEDTFWDEEARRVVPPDWIVCSPKLPEHELVLERYDELKLVVPDYRPEAYASFADRATRHELGTGLRRLLWLQPEDGPRLDEATQLAVDLALDHPDWRVSVQTHKVLGVD